MHKAPRAWALAGASAAVVLGRSQHGLAVHSALPVRRRASGGGAVLAGPWLLRAGVRLPRGHALLRHGPGALARWMGEVHLQWLADGGVHGARLHEGPAREHWACFAGCSTGEVTVGGRKLTGIAQVWRRSGVFVAAGTLLQPPPWPLLCEALARPAHEAAELAAATVTLAECMQRPASAAEWAGHLRAALQAALHGADPAAARGDESVRAELAPRQVGGAGSA